MSTIVKSTYTIEEVAEIASVNSFTLRNWEDRYQLFQPMRDANGRRIFTEDETVRALCAAELVKRNYKIGKVATDFRAYKDPCDVLSKYVESEYFLELRQGAVEGLLEFNASAIHMAFDYLIANFKIEFLADHFFYPLFGQIENLRNQEIITEFQAHFVHHHLASRLQRLIGFLEVNMRIKMGKKVVLVGLPGNKYEDSLLILYLLLERNGWDVIYGGKRLTSSELLPVVKAVDAKGVILVGNNLSNEDFAKEEATLTELPVPVILGGGLGLRLSKEGRVPPSSNIEFSTLRPGPIARLLKYKLL